MDLSRETWAWNSVQVGGICEIINCQSRFKLDDGFHFAERSDVGTRNKEKINIDLVET